MVKTIIKEIIITLLLILATILVLMVIFYNYIPNKKIVPKTISYTTPAEVKQEIATSNDAEQTEVVMTYEINSGDLNNYKRTQDYVAGRKNPFSSINSNTNISGENTNANSSGNQNGDTNNTNNSNNINNDNNQTKEQIEDGNQNNNNYLPNKGTK